MRRTPVLPYVSVTKIVALMPNVHQNIRTMETNQHGVKMCPTSKATYSKELCLLGCYAVWLL
jgi:hypothetical protein